MQPCVYQVLLARKQDENILFLLPERKHFSLSLSLSSMQHSAYIAERVNDLLLFSDAK